MTSENVILTTSKSEAIVLFDFLVRFNKQVPKELFVDQAEQRVLWNLEAYLEKQLTEPFLDNYPEIVERAREELRFGH